MTQDRPDLATLGALLFDKIHTKHNVVYRRSVALDVYLPNDAPAPNRTVVFVHGGGWVSDDRKETVFPALPFALSGRHLVSVGYRLADRTRAPAAAEEVRSALAWLDGDADRLGIDRRRIILMGISARSLLAALAAFAPDEACLGSDRTRPPTGTPSPAGCRR